MAFSGMELEDNTVDENRREVLKRAGTTTTETQTY